jgi:hypothetical protein
MITPGILLYPAIKGKLLPNSKAIPDLAQVFRQCVVMCETCAYYACSLLRGSPMDRLP